MQKSILILDGDKKFVENLKYNFNKEHYNIDCIYTSKLLLKKILNKKYDLVILEEDIDNMKGTELCKLIRDVSIMPIIVLSKIDDEISKILAFEYGADDYLIKPFSIEELKVRIKTIFRRIDYRIPTKPQHIFNINNFTVNFLKRSISINRQDINLTGKEFDLFYVLASNPDKVFSREELLDEVWGYEHYGDVRTVDVHIRRIREKIDKHSGDAKYIMTKWGEGYYFNNVD